LTGALNPKSWAISAEADADVVPIDLDSFYGQLSWMRRLPGKQIAVGVTAALRADTPHRLPSPFAADDLARVLGDLAGCSAHAAAPAETNRLANPLAKISGAFAVGFVKLPAKSITALSAGEAAVPLQAAGDLQPLRRLVWLLALVGGDGQLQGYGADQPP